MEGKLKLPEFKGGRDEFTVWQRQMKSYATLNGVGTALTAAQRNADHDTKLYHLLVVAVSDAAASIVSRVEEGFGKKLWDELQEHYGASSEAAMHAVHSSLLDLKMDPSQPPTELAERMEKKMDQLRIAGRDMEATESIALAHLCKQLPTSYSALVLRIGTDNLKWRAAVKELRMFADRLGDTGQKVEAGRQRVTDEELATAVKAFFVTNRRDGRQRRGDGDDDGRGRYFDGDCYFCGKHGHRQWECREALDVLRRAKGDHRIRGGGGGGRDGQRADGGDGEAGGRMATTYHATTEPSHRAADYQSQPRFAF